MTVIGVCMVKDEEDVIGYTLSRMAEQLDHVIIADNLSTDMTRLVLERVSQKMGNITILDDPEPAYLQSHKVSHLARLASEMGADIIVPFDADEVMWHPQYRLADYPFNPATHVFQMALYDHVVTRIDDKSEPDTVRRIGWRRDEPCPLPKVICRVSPGLIVEMGAHSATYPGPVETEWTGVEVRHYPYRSVEQMVSKAVNGKAAYDAAGSRLPATAGLHWRRYGQLYEDSGVDAIKEIFETWFYSTDPEADVHLVYDPPCRD